MKKLLFIGLLGLILSLSIVKPCMATGEFTALDADFVEMRGDIAWGDYNNDGFLDFIEVGTTYHAMYPDNIVLYKNNGNGTFSVINNTGLIGTQGYARVKWVDLNNDSYLDLIVQGWLSDSSPGSTKIYHNNNGNGTFTDTNVVLPAVDAGDIALADFNGDEKVDILITGSLNLATGANLAKLYRNDGNNIFTEVATSLLPFCNTRVAWGDYDNDGKQDLLISGFTGGIGATKLYRNDGPGTQSNTWNFTEITIQTNSTTLQYIGAVAWGDYNNDGMLDFVMSSYYSDIYRNDGIGTESNTWKFTAIDAGLMSSSPNCSWGDSVSWGDYDNDGYLDLLMTAETYSTEYIPHTEIYHSDGPVGPGGQWQFTDINAGLQGVHEGNIVWGDYDNDGDLDIALNGKYNFCGVDCVTKIYRNNLGSDTSVVNTVPNAPTSLLANVSGSNVTLSWQKATDNQTPQNGLYYNIFIGTSPNLVDTLSPMAQLSDGWRRLAAIGSQNENTSWTINSLADGTYYWGVQAIDTAFAGSPFALGTFTVGEPTTWTISGMVTLDGDGLPGIELYEEGTGNLLATTQDPSGYYEILDLPAGEPITVSPYDVAYTFDPTHKAYTGSTGNQENQDYAATLKMFTISGVIEYSNGTGGVEGVDLKDQDGNLLAITNQNGFYSFQKEYDSTFDVTPSKDNHIFGPQMRSYSDLQEDKLKENYKAEKIFVVISGYVFSAPNDIILAGVVLEDNEGTFLDVTDESGFYSFEKSIGWSGIVTPSKKGYIFKPKEKKYENIQTNYPDENYLATREGAISHHALTNEGDKDGEVKTHISTNGDIELD